MKLSEIPEDINSMKSRISLAFILILAQFSAIVAQSQLELTLNWQIQDNKKVVACTVKNISDELITIYEREYQPMTFIFPNGSSTFPYRGISCGDYIPATIFLSPNEQQTVFYDPDSFFGNTFTTRKTKEHGEYQILWEVKGAQSNVLTYQYINPYLPKPKPPFSTFSPQKSQSPKSNYKPFPPKSPPTPAQTQSPN